MWTKQETNGVLLLNPPKTQDGEVLVVMVIQSIDSDKAKSARGRFSDFLAGVDSKTNVKSRSEISASTRGDLQAFIQVEQLTDKDLGDYEALYQMVTDEKHDAFVGVISKGDKTMAQYQDVMSSILASVRPVPAQATLRGAIRTGDTPDLYPGMPGWLPSGKGVPIPAPAIIKGSPVGMWFKTQYESTTFNNRPVLHIYLADGTRASNPRLGGGLIFDIEGQRKQKGVTGLGTFAISDGQIVENYDTFKKRAAFSIGDDSTGKFFKVDGAKFRPLIALTNQSIVGHWGGPGIDYKFKSDGTFESGMTHANGDWAVANFHSGTFILDGYLIMFTPKDGPSTVTTIGRSGDMLITNSGLFFKK